MKYKIRNFRNLIEIHFYDIYVHQLKLLYLHTLEQNLHIAVMHQKDYDANNKGYESC